MASKRATTDIATTHPPSRCAPKFAIKDAFEFTFKFVKCSPSTIQDPNAAKCSWKLTHKRSTDSASAERNSAETTRVKRLWITEFDTKFERKMVKAMHAVSASPPGAGLKIKAAFGCHYFRLRPKAVGLATEELTFSQLQQLKVYREVVPQWANECSRASVELSRLLDQLEALVAEQQLTPRNVLNVFLEDTTTKHRLSMKFHWINGTWIRVERPPIRRVHALYDIIHSDSAAFRIRVCSRDSLDIEELDKISSLLALRMPLDGDIFGTTAVLRSTADRKYVIKSFTTKQKYHITWRGLRFTLAYMQPDRNHARVECRVLQRNASTVSLPQTMGKLVRGIVKLLSPP
ncbi:hypothetical protein PINS_up001756 [Pythium insidiosum]|nr:hypothetical protein PINS_up001756 [Pythium insidiosum]